MIPYGRQHITQDDIDSVTEILKSDFLTQGPKVPLFEEILINKVGAKYGVAVNSATSALHIACMSLNLSKGDILWTSSVTFVASANCGVYCGASIDFVDIDLDTYNICMIALEKKLKQAKKEDKLPKILVVVHLCGQSTNMDKIFKLSKKYNFKVIEDASHAIGAKYKNNYVGDCKYSDITVFSFHPVKIITTAEGGMAVTNSEEIAHKMQLYRSHGITRDEKFMTESSHGPWFYQQIDLGFNYRMTELQAALGISQIKRLDEYISKRHEIAEMYNQMLSQLDIITPKQCIESYSSYHLYVIRLDLKKLKKTHKEIFIDLRSNGVGVNLHYIPLYLHPYYEKMGFDKKLFPNSETYYSEAISIPIFQTLKNEDFQKVCDVLDKVIS
jgi:UDP-4-amino-4,6-dideoxy-N-acetyl-beta-L-altrosamine transaminase